METDAMKLKLFLSAAAAMLAMQLSAKVTLAPVFTDNMVLQQKTEVKFWGKAKPERKALKLPLLPS
jgi:hypothetical protein